jgi:hypothetical protein
VSKFFELPFNAMIESFGHKIVLGNKNKTSIPNSFSPLRCVGFVLFNKQ